MGAAVVMQLTIDRPGLVTHLILQSPVSPVGFGGTQGVHGGPNADDFAGSGGGVASPDFCRLLAQGDRTLTVAVATALFSRPSLTVTLIVRATVDGLSDVFENRTCAIAVW